jgi:dipeptidyl aminopeptidase/acylaminoacyl peptidase
MRQRWGRRAKTAWAITAAIVVAPVVMACGFGLPEPPPCTSCALERQYLRQPGPITDVEWSPDSTRIATSSGDGSTRVWDVATGKQVKEFDEISPVRAVRWTPDAGRLITAGPDVRVFNASTGDLVQTIPVAAHSIDLHGDRLAIGGDDGIVHLWDLSTGEATGQFTPIPTRDVAVETVLWSPDGTRLIVRKAVTTVWDANRGVQLLKVTACECDPQAQWSPDGTMIVLGEDAVPGENSMSNDLNSVTDIVNVATGASLTLDRGDQTWGGVVWDGDVPRGVEVDIYNRTGVVDSATRLPVAPTRNSTGVPWSPDGTMFYVVYSSARDVGIYAT